MACIPTQLSSPTSGQTTLPGAPPEDSSPPQQALAETVGPLVQHDDFQLIDVNASLFDACESQDIAWIKEAINGGAESRSRGCSCSEPVRENHSGAGLCMPHR